MTNFGVCYCVDFVDVPLIINSCINCGEVFVLESHAVVTIYALGERLGDIGPCRLAPCARERLAAESEKFSEIGVRPDRV